MSTGSSGVNTERRSALQVCCLSRFRLGSPHVGWDLGETVRIPSHVRTVVGGVNL